MAQSSLCLAGRFFEADSICVALKYSFRRKVKVTEEWKLDNSKFLLDGVNDILAPFFLVIMNVLLNEFM